MFIARDQYLQKMIKKQNNGFIKIITGIRRVGKSFLLFNIFKKHLIDSGVKAENIIEIQLDSIEYRELRDSLKLYQYIKDKIKPTEKYYVFLDEIQFVDQFVDVLNGLLYLSNVDVYVTGSNSKFLSSDILTEFRGRGDEIKVYPLSFAEYFNYNKQAFDVAYDSYLLFGGLPRVLSFEEADEKSQYLKNLFAETYIKDIVQRNNVKKEADLEDLINTLASAVGSLTNANKLARTFKSQKNSAITYSTINEYIKYLLEAFLIDSALRYDIKGKKYIGTPLKYYFTDLGLRNARLNFRQVEETHLMENIIFNELKIRNYNVDVGVVDIRENQNGKRLRKQLEVDFIAAKGNRKYYIQVAYALLSEDKKRQEKKSLNNINNSFKKIIITRNSQNTRIDEDGIVTISLQTFLLNKNSLEEI